MVERHGTVRGRGKGKEPRHEGTAGVSKGFSLGDQQGSLSAKRSQRTVPL
jgi:hypothetical protein